MNTHFILFSNCIIVKGAKRSILCDLQKNKRVFVPNDLAEVVFQLEGNRINKVIKEYGEENKKTIMEYLDYLEDNDFGFFCGKKEKKHFPKMDMKFETPNYVSNAVLEMKQVDYKKIESVFKQLNELKCESLHLLLQSKITVKDIRYISQISRNTTFKSIEITAKFNPNIDEIELSRINKIPTKIVQFIFYSSNKELVLNYGDNYLFKVIYVKTPVINSKSCGNVSSHYMYVNRDKFLESLHHNSCLHKKIAIDTNGNIKNCPSMAQSFGNIKDTSLQEALNHKDFKKYWNITKDQIAVCKACEFRYVCTDCRAYREDPEDVYSKPLKCGYDPYTTTWEEWSTHPLKQNAIDFYGMQDVV